MTCRTFTDPANGISAIICTRGPKKMCSVCKQREVAKLCDFKLSGTRAGKTCDKPLCSTCVVVMGPNIVDVEQNGPTIDYCPTHARFENGVKEARAREAKQGDKDVVLAQAYWEEVRRKQREQAEQDARDTDAARKWIADEMPPWWTDPPPRPEVETTGDPFLDAARQATSKSSNELAPVAGEIGLRFRLSRLEDDAPPWLIAKRSAIRSHDLDDTGDCIDCGANYYDMMTYDDPIVCEHRGAAAAEKARLDAMDRVLPPLDGFERAFLNEQLVDQVPLSATPPTVGERDLKPNNVEVPDEDTSHAFFCARRTDPRGRCECTMNDLDERDQERTREAHRQSIASKARHVTSARQTRKHHCHWTGCEKEVPPAQWGCRKHWYQLPKKLRDKIWREYRRGQEISLSPSRAYLEVMREVEAWIFDRTKQDPPASPVERLDVATVFDEVVNDEERFRRAEMLRHNALDMVGNVFGADVVRGAVTNHFEPPPPWLEDLGDVASESEDPWDP